MRMRFEAGAEEEFEAACGLLVDRLVRWAGQQGLPVDGFVAEAALDCRHRATADGRLGLWEPRHVEELLLGWLPETITELPGEERGDAPGTLRTLLRYLHAARLADPRGPALEDSLAAVDAVAELYPGAMATVAAGVWRSSGRRQPPSREWMSWTGRRCSGSRSMLSAGRSPTTSRPWTWSWNGG